jgi:GT2 family glycosyltransferase
VKVAGASAGASLIPTPTGDGWCSPHILPFLTAAKVAAATGERDIRITVQHNNRPFDYARNVAAKAFLESGCEWLLMVDNDMAAPVDLLDMLDRVDDTMDIVVPKFYSLGDAGLFVCWRSLEGYMTPAVEKVHAEDEWIELSNAGSGCMFIRRRVFEVVQRPWFSFVYDEQGEMVVTEDYYLCLKARDAGCRVYGNLNFEVDHFKTVSLCAFKTAVVLDRMNPQRPVSFFTTQARYAFREKLEIPCNMGMWMARFPRFG